MERDRFGNPHAPGLPYARGELLPDTGADLAKLAEAWRHVQGHWERGARDSVHLLSGLERRLPAEPEDLELMDDELASALLGDRVRTLALEHLGGDPARHDVMLLNRLTVALLVAAEVTIAEGERVIGVSPRYSHPAVVRAVARARGRFRDATGLAGFREALRAEGGVDVVFVTRLAVSYECLDEAELLEVLRIARAEGARILLDDAGGARVGPAVFGQPRMLELDVDAGATGLDKYGTVGPRLGLLGGDRELVARIRGRAYEMGIEARQMLFPAVVRSLEGYRPERVRALVDSTMAVGEALERRISANRLFRTPVTVQLRGEDVLEMAMERAGLEGDPPCVPYEATAGLAMLMLRDHGIVTVHFAGIPPGTAALMIKFLPPEALARLGGPERFAEAVDRSLDRLGEILREPGALERLLRGAGIGADGAAPGGAMPAA
jgi:L-seryl-tRNA(Ser) seleniumtransferase